MCYDNLFQQLVSCSRENDQARLLELRRFVEEYRKWLNGDGYTDTMISGEFYCVKNNEIQLYKTPGYMTVKRMLQGPALPPEFCFLSFCRLVIRWQNGKARIGQPLPPEYPLLKAVQVNELLKKFYGKRLSAKNIDDLVKLTWAMAKVETEEIPALRSDIQYLLEQGGEPQRDMDMAVYTTTMLQNEILCTAVEGPGDLLGKISDPVKRAMRQCYRSFADYFRSQFLPKLPPGAELPERPECLRINGLLSMSQIFLRAARGQSVPERAWLVRLGLRCRLTPLAVDDLLEKAGYKPLGFYAWELAAKWLLSQDNVGKMSPYVFLRSLAHVYKHMEYRRKQRGTAYPVLPAAEFAAFNYLSGESKSNRELLTRMLYDPVQRENITYDGERELHQKQFYWEEAQIWPDLFSFFAITNNEQTCGEHFFNIYQTWLNAVEQAQKESDLAECIIHFFGDKHQPANKREAEILALVRKRPVDSSTMMGKLYTLSDGVKTLPAPHTLLFFLYCQAIRSGYRGKNPNLEPYLPASIRHAHHSEIRRGQLIFAASFYIIETGHFPFVFDGEPSLPPYNAELFLQSHNYSPRDDAFLYKVKEQVRLILEHYHLI